MTTAQRPVDRDEILFAFNQACPVPTAEQIIEWCDRYPELAEDIRDHAAISRDWAAQESCEAPPISETVLARGFSRVLNLLHEAENAPSAAPTVQSFRQAAQKQGLDVPKLAKKLDIDRNVLSTLFNGRMLAPAGRRLVAEIARALQLSEQRFHVLHQAALASPQLGHAKSTGAPTIKPQPYETIVQESQMTPERKRYWLGED